MSDVEKLADAINDPGLPEHLPRPTDVDPKAEKRAERQVAALFSFAALLFVGFVVAYIVIDIDATIGNFSALNVALGATLGGGLLAIGIGAIHWAKTLMTDHEIVEYRHPISSSATDRKEALAVLNQGAEESGFARRPLLRNSLLGSLGLLGLPAIVLLRDLGPMPHGQYETVWKRGMRVVNDVSGLPIKPSDMEVGQLVNGQPAVFFETDSNGEPVFHGHELLAAKAKAAVIVVRMRPEDITPAKGRENWGVNGILCYSKICTHVGCPISLWERQSHNVLCPCHQSTFDLSDNGKVLFGPAHRPLPQLPLAVDAEGYLIATGDFPDIVAPSYPELARDQKRLDEQS